MWRRRIDLPAEIESVRSDLTTIMEVLFDLRRDVGTIRRHVLEEDDGEEEANDT